MRIALVAGETSGDMLGAGLIRSLKEKYPEATFEGIGGPMMQSEGMVSFVPMERLSVMGLVEVLGRLFELINVRKKLVGSLCKRHAVTIEMAPTACKRMVSGSISLLYSRFFSPFPHGTSSLSVSQEYLALADGPARFTQDYSCPALLRIPL